MSTLLAVVLWVLLIWSALIVVVTAVLMTVDADAATHPGRRGRRPEDAASLGRDRRRDVHRLHVRARRCSTTCSPRSGARSVEILLESYIIKGDEMGRRFKQALIDAAERGVEVYVIYDQFANLVVQPVVLTVPRAGARAALPALLVVDPRAPAPQAWGATTARSSSSTTRSGSSAATTSAPLRHRVARHPPADRGPRGWDLDNAFVDFWNTPSASGRPPELSDPGAVRGSRGSGRTATCPAS